jgi:N-acetylglucosaminyl-diphospho-decaprenol L-rhamnosyltransferase
VTDVSVVIPNRDGGALLRRCLDAVGSACGVGEVVVVDDGSTDGSPEEAAARAGVRVERSPGRGFAVAANFGVAATAGDLVLMLNSDAFVEPDTVELLALPFAGRPRLALCGAALVHEDGSRAKTRDRPLTLVRAVREALSLHLERLPEGSGFERVDFVPLACALVRRRAWEEIGGLDERYRFYYEDHDLCWRLIREGWEVGVRWDATAVHVEGGSSRVHDPAAWFRRYHVSRLAYLRKRYPAGWPLYLAVWAPSAAVHSAAWVARASARRDRRGLAWASAYARAAVPL